MSEPEEPQSTSPELPSSHEDELEPVVEKISTEHGFDVRGYKRTTLYRRIRKRMVDARCATMEDYLVRLETDSHEYAQLVNTILINVTEFFRDPAAWEYFQRECLTPLARKRSPGEPIRAWCVGCATGEEAYSLSICLAELSDGPVVPAKIYATDMDEGALAVARAGIYNPDDLRHVSAERRQRFFEELPGGRYRMRREVRSAVIFGHHNVLEDAPISRLDILVCRNLLIYFDNDTQQQLLKRYHYALRDGGYLFLGKAETLMSRSPYFRVQEPRHRVFQRVPLLGIDTRPGQRLANRNHHDSSVPSTVREHAIPLEQVMNPSLLLDATGTLIAASPSAREIFGITERLLGGSLAQLDERVRPAPLRLAIEDVRTTIRPSRVEDLHLIRADGKSVVLNVELRPMTLPSGELHRILLWGDDVSREVELNTDLSQVRQELETTSEELQTTNEELETTNEELQSTNEELETTNEELQSTNEELETTIEELQSTNEELVTTNDELRARQEELNDRERFQTMILSSLQLGLIVVKGNWEVTSWNRMCEDLWGLREEEVMGQNLFQLDTGMPFEILRQPLVSVINGTESSHIMEVDATNRRGKRVRCRVRLHPLAAPADGTAGAMIVIDNVTERV